ncbi:3-dehydroquinate dehydratase 2 [Siccirubricoccus deserti]|uniref:3-dehydroquinate dehydratase n=1 Tax=Siccirubricoccus deserti TaxID=2013562 RepID=A0A9X0UIP8_9PROT|nr:type II 3-dehydroquinate dehydratase [Siccirubricoccus deserti]MBC4017260.1 3-dehydroquinate dehydratase [Siccirubricoccus deserti]GGC57670.1 3-dehydroquinate dehydratase 2 [Siccirubricoccus deserti]
MPTAYFLNGPNVNLYGLDRSGTYGSWSFPAIRARCLAAAERAGLVLECRQTNDEGQLIDWLQEARERADGVLINAAGLSYTSIAVMDALLMIDGPVLEVHMSNIHRREAFRHATFISRAATATICGLGPLGYELAIGAMAELIAAGARR